MAIHCNNTLTQLEMSVCRLIATGVRYLKSDVTNVLTDLGKLLEIRYFGTKPLQAPAGRYLYVNM